MSGGNGNKPTPIKIFVSRQGNSHKLRLRDSLNDDPTNIGDDLTTLVEAGNTIQWVLDPNISSDPQKWFPIAEIKSIIKAVPTPGPPPQYQNSIPVLVEDPKIVDGVWTGTVLSTSPGKDKFENYNVGFTIANDPNPDDPNGWWWDDPKIKMKA
jgi:hypothetical protein